MKRLAILFSVLICVLVTTGCFGDETKEQGNGVQPEIFGEKNNNPDENDDSSGSKEVSEERPSLTVVCCEQSVTALKGTSTWTSMLPDGTKQSICSDSMHPLQAVEYMEPLSLMPSIMSRYEPLRATLIFDKASPDKVTVRCWDESCIDKPDSSATEIKVDVIEVDFADGTWTQDYTFMLLDGNYIYEVIAEWNMRDEYEGVVHYSFYTTKWSMTPVPIDNVQKS